MPRCRGDGHSSRPPVTRTARATYPKSALPCGRLERAAPNRLPIWSCTTRSLPSRAVSPHPLVGSYPTVSPITCLALPPTSAGLFSVALVVGSPRLVVSQLVALRCSDFPLSCQARARQDSDRPVHYGSAQYSTCKLLLLLQAGEFLPSHFGKRVVGSLTQKMLYLGTGVFRAL